MQKNQEGRQTTLLGGKGLALTPPGGSGKPPCYFFNHGGCKNGKCKFGHVDLPAAEKAKMTKPVSRSQSPPKGPGATTGDGPKGPKGGSGGPGSSASPGGLCHFFMKGKCTRGDACRFTHVSQEELDRVNKAKQQAAPKAEAKAKAQPKGKAKATANLVPRPTLAGAHMVPTCCSDE